MFYRCAVVFSLQQAANVEAGVSARTGLKQKHSGDESSVLRVSLLQLPTSKL